MLCLLILAGCVAVQKEVPVNDEGIIKETSK